MMSFAASIHTNGASHHFERTAKILLDKRRANDLSSCDLKILLSDSIEMVHSVVISAHSATISAIIESSNPPYAPINMKKFNENSVKRVIDWMYTGEISIPLFQLRDDLAVASYLKISILQRQFEKHLKSMSENEMAVTALNIASTNSFSVTEDTLLHIVLQLCRPDTKPDTDGLTLQSIFAIMSTMLNAEEKVPLVNMALKWTRKKKTDRTIVNSIVNSIVMRDVPYYQMNSVKFSLKKYLEDPTTSSRTFLAISTSGDIVLSVVNDKSSKRFRRSLFDSGMSSSSSSDYQTPMQCPNKSAMIRSDSHLQLLNSLPDPFESHIILPQSRNPAYRTNSEIAELKELADPFEKSKKPKKQKSPGSGRSSSPAYCRLTNDGYPKVFTKSEVDMLVEMKDPFVKSPADSIKQNDDTGIPPGFKMNESKYQDKLTEKDLNVIKFAEQTLPKPCLRKADIITKSERQMIKDLPNPFKPVEMPPAVGCVSPFVGNPEASTKEKPMFSMSPNYRPDFVVSPDSVKDQQTTNKLIKSPSEVMEINALKPIRSNSSIKKSDPKNGTKKSGSSKNVKSHYLYID